jgi:hypothetical protein
MAVIKKQNLHGLEVCDIKSSNISKTIYSGDNKELIIEFKKGGKYGYKPVSQELYTQFLNSSSQGSFFVHGIKNNKDITCSKI